MKQYNVKSLNLLGFTRETTLHFFCTPQRLKVCMLVEDTFSWLSFIYKS